MINPNDSSQITAVLGPTNTGKTHLAIERMCAHSSGMIGFPLRLLAREVYDKVCAIKGEAQVALITGEERIEPPHARYFLCTAEAMDRTGGDKAFVALDEAQLSADRERGHIFTDRLIHARGRDETMLLGSSTIEPIVRDLIPSARIEERPRFSTLTHTGSSKLSRLPPRSAIVAFSVEQVYQLAELLRRYRGGAAVVMGALSPQTRNRQVELFQSGEVDYLVATDAIGMGLNLDLHHVAFGALSKFDGMRQRRLFPAEMAQIAGRAGRHQRDGTFGTLSGSRKGGPLEFTEEEIWAIENHEFAPATNLFWRNSAPRFASLDGLINDLERHPKIEHLTRAPEAIDLAILKRLSERVDIRQSVSHPTQVERFWQVCQLPDFRQQGAEAHSRFVARLWEDLQNGYIGEDFVASRLHELDQASGHIDTLQGRLAAIRSWAYICQRPDWVLAREEMAQRARAIEAKLSDALHQRLSERFINRRTAILMKGMGKDAQLLQVQLEEDGQVTVEGQLIGKLEGFSFVVDPSAHQEDRRLMLAAAEKHMASLLGQKAKQLISEQIGELRIEASQVLHDDQVIAQLERGKSPSQPNLAITKDLSALDPAHKAQLIDALNVWLENTLAPLAPLRALEEGAKDPEAGSEVRALLLTLATRAGSVQREAAGLAKIPKEKRPMMRKLGVNIGSLDVYVPMLLKPAPRKLMKELGLDDRPLHEIMEPVMEPVADPESGKRQEIPAGYRKAGQKAIRVDMAEKLIRAAHEQRLKASNVKGVRGFPIDIALATSMGLSEENFRSLMKDAGFRAGEATELAEGVFGPPPAVAWTWKPLHKDFRQQNSRHQNNRSNGDAQKRNSGKGGARDGGKKWDKNKSKDGGNRSDRDRQRESHKPASGKALAGLADLFN